MRIIDTVVGDPTPGQPDDEPENVIYIADPNGNSRIASHKSNPSLSANSETCDVGTSSGVEWVNGIKLIDLDALFTRPFHVQPDEAK